MRFKITGDHRSFFAKERHIEFENFLSEIQLQEISQALDQVLAQRLRKLIEIQSPKDLYLVGRDVWRGSPLLQTFVCHPRLADVAAQLSGQKQLKLAFDQAFRTSLQTGFSPQPPLPLNDVSCIQPLAGAALIRLTGDRHPASFIPSKKENVVFLAPDFVFPWEILFQEPHHTFLLVAYAPAKALYILEKRDPHVHGLKKLGYGFGDHLNEAFHPIVFK